MPMFRIALIAVLAATVGIPPVAHGQSDEGDASRAMELLGGVGALPRAAVCAESEEATTARQIIRLHTELMVASLACAEAYGWPRDDLYIAYRQFTVDHAEAILDAQTEVEREFGVGDDGERQFDGYRTVSANEEAGLLNTYGLGRYCAMRRARFDTLMSATPAEFEGYADALAVRPAPHGRAADAQSGPIRPNQAASAARRLTKRRSQ